MKVGKFIGSCVVVLFGSPFLVEGVQVPALFSAALATWHGAA